MDCSDFRRMLDNYENLTDSEMSGLTSHAAECDACRGELEFYKSIMHYAASLPAVEPPADLIDKINNRIDSLPKRINRFDTVLNNVRSHTTRYGTIAACLVVGIVVGLNAKTIGDRLTDDDTDGVIETTVAVSNPTEQPQSEYEIVESSEAEEVIPENTAAPLPQVVTDKAPKTTSAAKQTAAISPSVSKAANTAAPAANAPASGEAAVTSEPTSAPAAETAADTETYTLPAKYTIARGNYYIPRAEATQAPTEPPSSETVQVAEEKYQIAMGGYELPEEQKRELAKNKLVVNESEIDRVFEIMRTTSIKGTTEGYVASESSLREFLAKLDAEGLFYNYLECSQTDGEIIFRLLAN